MSAVDDPVPSTATTKSHQIVWTREVEVTFSLFFFFFDIFASFFPTAILHAAGTFLTCVCLLSLLLAFLQNNAAAALRRRIPQSMDASARPVQVRLDLICPLSRAGGEELFCLA